MSEYPGQCLFVDQKQRRHTIDHDPDDNVPPSGERGLIQRPPPPNSMTKPRVGQARPRRLLFLCVNNANFSQMAEGLARMHGANRFQVYSAGVGPANALDPRAIASMEELGYNLWASCSKSLSELPDEEFDVVVTMGCEAQECGVRARMCEHWEFPSTSGMLSDGYRELRQGIEAKVKGLVARLLNETE